MVDVLHQAHAARCRHQAAHQAKASYWAELNQRYAGFRLRYPAEALTRFSSVERNRAGASAAAYGFQESTIRTWLRAWRDQLRLPAPAPSLRNASYRFQDSRHYFRQGSKGFNHSNRGAT